MVVTTLAFRLSHQKTEGWFPITVPKFLTIVLGAPGEHTGLISFSFSHT